MLLRFQFGNQAFARILRGQFQRQDLCVPDPITPGPNPTYVDHIEVNGTGSLIVPAIFSDGPPATVAVPLANGSQASVPRLALLVNRAILVFTTTLNDLQAANDGPPATAPAPLDLQFSLDVSHQATGEKLTVAYFDINPAAIQFIQAANIDPVQLNATLKAKVPTVSVLLPVSAISSALGGTGSGPTAVWSGIAPSSDFTAVEIRIEFGTGGASGVADLPGWTNFYSHQGTETLADPEGWAIHIDKDLVIAIISALVTPAVQQSPKFSVQSGPYYSWNPALTGVNVTFNGYARGACECFWQTVDVNVDMAIAISFSLNQGLVQVDIHFDPSMPLLQAPLVCCGIQAVTDFLFGGGSSFVPSLPPPFVRDPNDNMHFSAQFSVTKDLSTPDDTLTLTGVSATAADLVLSGLNTDLLLRLPTIAVSVLQFAWQINDITCATSSAAAEAQVVVSEVGGDLDFFFCKATPSLNYTGGVSLIESTNPYTVTLVLQTGQTTVGPVTILLQTTAGARLVTLDPLPALTKQIQRQLQAYVKRWRENLCYTLVDPWFRYTHTFNLKWNVDPPIGEKEYEQIWQTAIAGLNPGDKVVVGDGAGNTLVTAFASAKGSLSLSVSSNTPEITLQRLPAGTEGGPDQKGAPSTTTQSLLRQASAVSFPAAVLALHAAHMPTGDQLLVATRAGLNQYHIDGHGDARLIGTLRLNLMGAVSLDGRLVAWDVSAKLIDLSNLAGLALPSQDFADSGLAAAAAGGLSHAVQIGKQIVAIQANTLRALNNQTLALPTQKIHALGLAGYNSFTARSATGQYLLYTLVGDSFQLSAIYEKRPWFDGFVTAGKWLFSIGPGRRTVRIFALKDKQTI